MRFTFKTLYKKNTFKFGECLRVKEAAVSYMGRFQAVEGKTRVQEFELLSTPGILLARAILGRIKYVFLKINISSLSARCLLGVVRREIILTGQSYSQKQQKSQKRL